MNKFLSVVSILALAGSTLAQGASFAYPQNGDTLVAGSNITIRIDRPTPSDPTVEAGIGLGMSPCSNDGCPPPTESFKYLFYAGGFDPQRPSHVDPNEDFNAFQNFTITVPADTNGQHTLGFLHSSFGRGADAYFPFFESVNVTVDIVTPIIPPKSTA